MVHRNKIAISLILVITLLSSSATAISAGISPPNITIESAVPGGVYEVNFTIYNLGNETTAYTLSSKGNITNWTSIKVQIIELEGKKAFPTTAKIQIPSNTDNGVYSGSILVKSIPNNNLTGNRVSVGISLPVTFIITRPGIGMEVWMVISAIILIIIGSGAVLILITMKNKRKESASNSEKTEGELLE